jgi:hypothetical protein
LEALTLGIDSGVVGLIFDFSSLGPFSRQSSKLAWRKKEGKAKNVEKEFFIFEYTNFQKKTRQIKPRRKEKKNWKHVLIKQQKINFYFKIDGVKTSGSLEE